MKNWWPSCFTLQKENLSPEEYEQRRTQLLNRHQMELSELDRQHAAEQKHIERGALTDWEVRADSFFPADITN